MATHRPAALVGLALLVIAMYLVAVPRDWQLSQVPCVEGLYCYRPRLFPQEIRMLESYGIAFQVYTTSIFGLRLVTALLYLVVAVIFWRKPRDSMALFGAYMLLTYDLLATGLVTAIFQPLRTYLQHGVNRLVYGKSEEPYAVLACLGQRLADTVTTDAVFPTVVSAVREALHLPYAAIAMHEQDELLTVAAVGNPTPNPLRLPLVYQHVPVGELVLSRLFDDELNGTNDRLLADLAQQVSVAVHAARLTRDLQVSREGLVTAREEERRRLRRDLHDGLGPSLAGLSMQLDTARTLMPDNFLLGMDVLTETQRQIKEAIENVRRLV